MKIFSLLALIWTLYYLAKRTTSNLLTCFFASAISWLPSIRNIGHPTPKRRTPMEDKNRRLEELLQTPCYFIDFLPQPIPPAALSQFRTIQHHLLNSEKRQEIKNRIVNILLKLLCFFPAFALWDGWKEQSSPQLIEQAVDTVMENHSGSLYLLFWQEESLLVFVSLSLYHPSQQLLDLAQTIARSEGFFLYQF